MNILLVYCHQDALSFHDMNCDIFEQIYDSWHTENKIDAYLIVMCFVSFIHPIYLYL